MVLWIKALYSMQSEKCCPRAKAFVFKFLVLFFASYLHWKQNFVDLLSNNVFTEFFFCLKQIFQRKKKGIKYFGICLNFDIK